MCNHTNRNTIWYFVRSSTAGTAVNVSVRDDPWSCLHDDPYIHYLLNRKRKDTFT